MPYIVDANNLAGKLKMLGDENFDKKLIKTIKRYNQGKQREIFLVFDSSDPYGDRVEAGENVTVIYSPKDKPRAQGVAGRIISRTSDSWARGKYYQSADDKIVELARRETAPNAGHPASDVIFLVTDDRDLIKRVKKLSGESSCKTEIISTTEFAQKLNRKKNDNNASDDKRGLSGADVNKINREMLGLWK